MKKISILITALIFLANFSFAQKQKSKMPKTSLKVGFGTAYYKPQNVSDRNALHFQYERRLFKPFRVSIDGFRIDGEKTMGNGHEDAVLAHQFDANLKLVLFSNENNALKIGGGRSWQSTNHRFTTSVERDANDRIINKSYDAIQEQSFGWNGSIEYEVYVIKHLVLGSRVSVQKYKNGAQNYFFGLNAGIRF